MSPHRSGAMWGRMIELLLDICDIYAPILQEILLFDSA
jgi:hypothetical protein